MAQYLSMNLVPKHEHANQWFFENPVTEVYYSFDLNEPNTDAESIELYECFDGFDNTNFSFNLNFMRPSFFGLEAFQFIEKMLQDRQIWIKQLPTPCSFTSKQKAELIC